MDIETKEIKHPRTKLRIENRDFLFDPSVLKKMKEKTIEKIEIRYGNNKVHLLKNTRDVELFDLFLIFLESNTKQNYHRLYNLDDKISPFPDEIDSLRKIFDKLRDFIGEYMKIHLGIDETLIPSFPSNYSNVHVIGKDGWYSKGVTGEFKYTDMDILINFSEDNFGDFSNDKILSFLALVMHEFLEFMSYKKFLVTGKNNNKGEKLTLNFLQIRQDVTWPRGNKPNHTGKVEQSEYFKGFHEGLIEIMIKDILQKFKIKFEEIGIKREVVDDFSGIYTIYQNVIYAILEKVEETYKKRGCRDYNNKIEKFKRNLFRCFFTGDMRALKTVKDVYGVRALKVLSVLGPSCPQQLNQYILNFFKGNISLGEVMNFLSYSFKE